MSYNLVLSMKDVDMLAGIAVNTDPEQYGPDAKQAIYKCLALANYQQATGDYRYSIEVQRS